MAKTTANGIQIEYETFGRSADAPLLLIVGLAWQLIQWDEALCEELARRGHYVIRFDNRDTGLSTKLEKGGIPDIGQILEARMNGVEVTPPYTIEDMADDAVGLLDALDIEKAHICGMSMGGMIAQTIALNHQRRVLSLISIYSHTGNPELPLPTQKAMDGLFKPPPLEREANITYTVEVWRTFSGTGFTLDEDWLGKIAAQAYDRAFYPEGVARQLAAVMAQKNRKHNLGSVSVPTLVIHGADDPLVPVAGGRDTAEAIPGAELMIIEGMGHDLPHGGAWPQIVDAIVDHTQKKS